MERRERKRERERGKEREERASKREKAPQRSLCPPPPLYAPKMLEKQHQDVGSTADKLKEYVLTKFLQLIAGNSPVPLVICSGEFALCAASTCKLTGANITLNSGVVKPEVVCRCPILKGPAIADLSAGNMQVSELPCAFRFFLGVVFFKRAERKKNSLFFLFLPKK